MRSPSLCLPRGRSRSIINIHEIVTSRWRIESWRRASGVRVKSEAGHTSLSRALVVFYYSLRVSRLD